MTTLFQCGIPPVDDKAIVELFDDKYENQSSIVATVADLRRLGYWNPKLLWRYAEGELADRIANGKVPQWRCVIPVKPPTDEEPVAKPSRPYIDDSNPNNPIFRHKVGDREHSITLQYLPKDKQSWLANIIAAHLNEAYISGQQQARAEIQTAIRDALML